LFSETMIKIKQQHNLPMVVKRINLI